MLGGLLGSGDTLSSLPGWLDAAGLGQRRAGETGDIGQGLCHLGPGMALTRDGGLGPGPAVARP